MVNKIRGFTLVELMIVIAIIGVLVTMVLIAIDPLRVINDTRDTKDRTELNQVKTALQLYFNENDDYPTDAEFITNSGAVNSPPNLTPTYSKQLPVSITDGVQGTDWDYAESGTDYDAWVVLNNGSDDDEDSVTKCSSDTDLTDSVPADNAYMICPD